jgi:AraC-like DNA-binding protein
MPAKSIGAIPPDLREIPGRDVGRKGAGTRERMTGWGEARWMMAYHIIAVGISRTGPGFAFARRPQQLGVVMACLGGEGRAVVDGRARRFARGDVYRMPADTWHCYWAERTPWTVVWVCYAERRPRVPVVQGEPAVLAGDGTRLAAHVDALVAEVGGRRDQDALGHLAPLIDLEARRLIGAGRGPDDLAAVWRAVEGDPTREWRLGDLARLAGIGAESLRLACQRSTGRSPMAHLAYLRMQRAARLLADPAATVVRVAEQVGYGNAFSFSTAFKHWMGMPPAVYQGRRRGEEIGR